MARAFAAAPAALSPAASRRRKASFSSCAGREGLGARRRVEDAHTALHEGRGGGDSLGVARGVSSAHVEKDGGGRRDSPYARTGKKWGACGVEPSRARVSGSPPRGAVQRSVGEAALLRGASG